MANILFSPHFILAQVADGTRRSYNATFIHTDATGSETTLHFSAHRRFIGKGESGVFICELQRDSVSAEGSAHNPLDDLAARCGAVLYPMPVRLHTAGHALGLAPNADLPRRWTAERPMLEQSFSGEGAAAYLDAVDRRIANPPALSAAVCESLFFQTFFAPIYQPYGTGEPFECTLYYRAVPGARSVAFACTLRLEKELDHGGGVVVTIEGECADGQSMQALFTSQAESEAFQCPPDFLTGQLSLRYVLQPRTHILQHAEGSISLTEGPADDEEGPRLVAAVEILIEHLPDADVPGPAVLPPLHSEDAAPKKKRWHFF